MTTIKNHNWMDSDITTGNMINENDVQLETNSYYIYINISDVIALAKHFKLTEEDLK